MTIKDKRAAVVEAAKDYASPHTLGSANRLIDRVRELEAAETPLKLEGQLHLSSYGTGKLGADSHVDLRGYMDVGTPGRQPCVTVTIRESDDILRAFARDADSRRFRFVLTEIMDDAS